MYDPLITLPDQVVTAAKQVKLVVLDVDGVLTDGQITYMDDKSESKSFNIKDGLGIKLLQRAGIEVAIITGRVSAMVARRAKELGIEAIIQGREDKGKALSEMLDGKSLELSQVAYMGDDLPDLAAIRAVGMGVVPVDANPVVVTYACLQTQNAGGRGAVRELADIILAAQQKYQTIVEKYL